MPQRRLAVPIRTGGRGVLGALREAQIVSLKPVFPAEILSSILDYVSAEDLISCACVSKRMREMVYDDTRWVRRLQLMGCWSETAARKQADEARRYHVEDDEAVGVRRATVEPLGVGRVAPLIMLNSPTTPSNPKPLVRLNGRSVAASDAFNETSGTAFGLRSHDTQATSLDPALEILATVQSVRGLARLEYGKAHAVLGPLYKDAARCKIPSNAKVFRLYRDPEQQAKMLAQLVRFSCADIVQGWKAREESMSAIVSAFEAAVFSEFEEGLRQDDTDGRLKKYAHVLYYLDGGARAVDAYLQHNPVTASPYRLGSPTDCVSAEGRGQFLPHEYLSFLRRLAESIHEQCNIIDRAFPSTADASESFIRAVSDAVLEPYLTRLFDSLLEQNTEQFIKAVPTTYLQNLGLLENIRSAPRMSQSETLLNLVQVVYGRYFDQYLNEELGLFTKRSETEVTGWERQLSQQDASLEAMYMSSVNRQADKRDFLSSFKKVVMAPVNILPVISFGGKTSANASAGESLGPTLEPASTLGTRVPSPQGLQRSTSSASKRISRSSSTGSEPRTSELEAKVAIMQSKLEGIKSLFSLEVALSLVHMAKSSIERLAIFADRQSPFERAAQTRCELVFVRLLQTLGEKHVRSGFNQAVEHLSMYNPQAVEQRGETKIVTPLVTFLELVNVGDLIQQMVDVFYEQELVAPKLIDKNDFTNITVKGKKKFEQMLDERVAAGLNKGIEVLISEVEYICATTQTTNDFNPGATGNSAGQVIDISTTKTARSIVDLVSTHTKMLTDSTDKNMLDVFNQEIGLRLFAALCKHLKRQRISVQGAPRLMSDMNHYFVFIQTLKNKDLLQYFAALRELSQIYLIDGHNAKELAIVIADHDRYSGIFGAEEVLEFAGRRADWYQIRPKVEKAMYGIGCAAM